MRKRLVLGVLLALWAQLGWAEPATQSLGDFVVTASRVEEPVDQVALKIVVIDREQIELSNATTVDQLLLEENVGHLHQYPGGLTQVTIRGLRSSSESAGFSNPILFLMDGRRAGTPNMSKIPVTIIERIEIIKGASSAVYGAEAMGGVINLITRKGSDDLSASLLAEAGSASKFRLAAQVGGTAGGLDFFASSERSDQRADYRTGSGDVYENTQRRGRDNFVNVGYTLGTHHLGLTVLEIDNWHVGNPNAESTPDLDDYSTKDLRSYDLRYDGALDSGELSWMMRYYRVDDRDTSIDPSMTWGYRESQFDTDTWGVQGQVAWERQWNRLIVGFDWDEQDARNVQRPTGTPYGVNADYERQGIFLSNQLALMNRRLLVTLGLRYDSYTVETRPTQGYNNNLVTDDEDVNEWIPRLGIVWLATDALRVKASVGRGILLPTASELVGDFYSWGTHYLGNKDLDPEETWTYEAGFEYEKSAWMLSSSLFYTDYKDKIDSDFYYDATLGEFVGSYKNIDGARISGVEAELRVDIGEMLQSSWTIEPFAAVTYLFELEDCEDDSDLLYVSDTQARFGVQLVSPTNFTCQLRGIYHGPQNIMNWNTYQEEEMGGFTLWNFSLSQPIAIPHSDLDVTVRAGIDNLLDKKYAYVYDYPMPGRQYMVSLQVDF